MSPIVGLAGNRLVSKVATRVVKPDGFVSVIPGDERTFLRFQDVRLLPGIGKKLTERMIMVGIRELGELADLSDYDITAVVGTKKGIRLRDLPGYRFDPVTSEAAAFKRIREEKMLDSDTSDLEEVEGHLFSLAEEAGLKLRGNDMLAGSVELNITYTDGIRTRGNAHLEEFSFCDRDFFDASRNLLWKIVERRVRIRTIALALSRLQRGKPAA